MGKWKCLRVSYVGRRAMIFEVDGKRLAEGVLTFTPTIDVAMPAWVGGVNANDQRFRGMVRRIRLRNTHASLGLR